MQTKRVMKKIENPDRGFWRGLFGAFPNFRNYIDYAFTSLEPELWADDPESPSAVAFYTEPAWFLTGDDEAVEADAFARGIGPGSWILTATPAWARRLEAAFGDGLETYPRQAFSPSGLSLERLRAAAPVLPAGLKIIRAGRAELAVEDSLLHRSVIDEFFLKDDFALRGLAFCVMDGERMVAFAASNYPLRGNDLEVFVRVADDPAYRRKGLGTAVSAALLSCCLERGITPHWDAANDASTALALKLGYIKTETWAMYHTKRGA